MAGTVCIFGPTCGLGMALEHNGDLYSCDHFVEPNYYLGNILKTPMIELVASEQQRKFGRDKKDSLPRYCRECEVLSICNGECPKNRFIETPDGESGLNYLCEGYKAFFKHADKPMRIMAELIRRTGRLLRSWPLWQGSGEISRQSRDREKRSLSLREWNEVQEVSREIGSLITR